MAVMPSSIDPSSAGQARSISSMEGAAVRQKFREHASQLSAIEDSLMQAAGAVSEPGLSQLQEQIKSVMIPLLMEIFSLKEAAQECNSPPTRLSISPTMSRQEVEGRLEKLKEDLLSIQRWTQHCVTRVQQVLSETQEQQIISPVSTKSVFSWFKRVLGDYS